MVQKVNRSVTNRILPLLFPFTIILLLRCAYLNCFYNAKMAFRKAYDAHMKLKYEGADTTEELPEEISAGYERAIKKTTKLIDVYPKRIKYHDDALFLKGKATYYNKNYTLAIRRLRQFQKEFPKSPFIPESYLYLGKSYLGNENLEKAEEIFLLILEKYPKLNKDEEITILMAEVAIRREGKSQAIRILEQSLKNIKSEEKRMAIILQLCDLYIDLKLYEKAVELCKKAPRNKENPNYLFKVDYYLLVCYIKQENYQSAINLADKMYKNKQYVKYMPKILLEKGIVLKSMGRIEKAIAIFDEITKGADAPEIQGKAWFELGLIYQHEYGDFEKAKECYEKVLSLSTDKELTEIAVERIKGIELKDQFHKEIADKSRKKKSQDDSSSIYETRYKMAEVYWINLAEVDSALNYYIQIISDTLADSVIYMKSLYARAWLLRFVKEDTTTSDSIYNAIIARYPATLLAKKAQQDLGVSVTVKTREDSATLAFIEAERLYFNDKNSVAAVNQFYKVARKYRDIQAIGANSLYAAAWLCDNVINKNKKAFMLYKKLCDDYPESDLCVKEAKPRIKIVEDTLKVLEIQKKKVKKRLKKKKVVERKITNNDTTTAGKEEDLLEQSEIDTSIKNELKVINTDSIIGKTEDLTIKGVEVQVDVKEENIKKE